MLGRRMPFELAGAYVQAWVWVELDNERDAFITDTRIREIAQDDYVHDGDIEIDHDAKVSRSYVGG